MKLVINIPKETFKYYVTLANKGEQIGSLERIILDGTPLPKHHGRLISEEDMLSVIVFSKLFDDAKVGEVYVLDNEVDRILIENAIYNGTPIIEGSESK